MRFQTLKEAKWILLALVLLAVGAWMLLPWLSSVPAAMILFTLYFFRDPVRSIPQTPNAITSPADGCITDIEMMEECEVMHQRMLRVGIFLSVFDVHVNRSPCDGRVTYTQEHDGDYHDARSPMASTHNCARTWGFEGPTYTIVVRQITGAIARRIVPWAKVGDRLKRGQHFGMIRFGSRTEIFLPMDSLILVSVGQHVKGGSTVIARTPSPRDSFIP
jgi:phosphatidylserine decarboxylase